jgi:hypothetical protein
LWDATQPERILLHAGGVNEISVCATREKQSGKRHYREEQRFHCPNFADVQEQKRRSHNHPFLGKSLEANKVTHQWVERKPKVRTASDRSANKHAWERLRRFVMKETENSCDANVVTDEMTSF